MDFLSTFINLSQVYSPNAHLLPHTHSTQKGLMRVAGKPIIDHVIEDIKKINPDEIYFVVGHRRADVKKHISENYPDLNCYFIHQEIRDGDGGAVRLALEKVRDDDELYIVFGADTLIDFDLRQAIKKDRGADAIIFGMEVENPTNYGVINHDDNMNITAVEEKPKIPKSNVAIIGSYYFKSALKVRDYLNYFYENKITAKGEYRIMQVIESYISEGLKLKVSKVDKWFDCGNEQIMRSSNRYFLDKKSNGKKVQLKGDNVIIPPVYIGKGAKLQRCTIGPYVSIGPNAKLKNVNIQDSIIGENAYLENQIIRESILGQKSTFVKRQSKVNLGANSEINMQ